MYLSDHQDENGIIQPRLVDINAPISKLYFRNLHFISKQDYKDASPYFDNPKDYDFHEILKWKRSDF
jgi:hypothetical protein